LGKKDELCKDNNNGAGKRNCERRHHVIEDAPSRIAPNSSEDYKKKISNYKF
jgi:hypothetical protein